LRDVKIKTEMRECGGREREKGGTVTGREMRAVEK
jgi:hypothetical protein